MAAFRAAVRVMGGEEGSEGKGRGVILSLVSGWMDGFAAVGGRQGGRHSFFIISYLPTCYFD